MGLTIGYGAGKQKEEIEDSGIWAWYSECSKIGSCFNQPLLKPLSFKFCPLKFKDKILKKMFGGEASRISNGKAKEEIIFGTSCKCSNWQILKFFLETISFLHNSKSNYNVFLT